MSDRDKNVTMTPVPVRKRPLPASSSNSSTARSNASTVSLLSPSPVRSTSTPNSNNQTNSDVRNPYHQRPSPRSSSSLSSISNPYFKKQKSQNNAVMTTISEPHIQKIQNKTDNDDDDDDDDDIEVISPRRIYASQQSITQQNSNSQSSSKGEEQEDEIQVESSNLTNANIDFPHARKFCGVHVYKKGENEQLHCSKCFCVMCGVPCSDCMQWKSSHCYKQPDESKKIKTLDDEMVWGGTSTSSTGRRSESNGSHNRMGIDPAIQQYYASQNEEIQRMLLQNLQMPETRGSGNNAINNSRMANERPAREMRITEVLEKKLQECLSISDAPITAISASATSSSPTPLASISGSNDNNNTNHEDTDNMNGDIPQLSLHNSFFMEGIRIGWPFPSILPPQRQMALHIIKALKKQLHVVLESPTGTGKSAAILCATLAWQRWHIAKQGMTSNAEQDEDDSSFSSGSSRPRIIYCSRTHSQVAQMIASLQKTPYRPRMTVLGSRERLCIHKKINPRVHDDDDHNNNENKGGEGNQQKNTGKRSINVNQECQMRVTNTEKIRKELYHSHDYHYDDDEPPIEWQGDKASNTQTAARSKNTEGDDDDGSADDNDDEKDISTTPDDEIGGSMGQTNSSEWIMSKSTKKLTCPHYRRLTSKTNAQLLQKRFVLPRPQISCCSTGGERTKLGVHDIEDLVQFGLNPYVKKNVAVYRRLPSQPSNGSGTGASSSFGITLQQHEKGCLVATLREGGAAEQNGGSALLEPGDRIFSVNGQNVNNKNLDEITSQIKETPLSSSSQEPLMLDVLANGEVIADGDDEPYASHSSCPYYASRALAKHAELIFCPYNYVLDAGIREALGIHLEGAVVVLDEAHNVEDTLCDSGSGKFGEYELSNILSKLLNYSSARKTDGNTVDVTTVDGVTEKKDLSDVAHELLLFVEKIVLFLRESRETFELGVNGAQKAIIDYQKFHTPDDHEFEVTYNGPSGHGVMGKPVGCKPFLDKVEITEAECKRLTNYAKAMETHVSGKRQHEGINTDSALFDTLTELTSKFACAAGSPEHFFVSSVAQANGNLEFASGTGSSTNQSRRRGERNRRFQKRPKNLPFVHPRSAEKPNLPVPVCLHKSCRENRARMGYDTGVRHGEFCNGSQPKWEAHLVLKLLSPGLLMKTIAMQARTLILASGSLAPIPSLCGELDLFPPKQAASPADNHRIMNALTSEPAGRLQNHPKPLEANHVVNLEKQLFAVSVGSFPDGSPLTVSYSQYRNSSFFPRLGNAIASVVEAIPRGGVLIFFPSYSFLRKCVKCWNPDEWSISSGDDDLCPDIWTRFLRSKGKVIVEPTGSQEKFEAAREEYATKIRQDGKCILLAVFRGKMSEGISFNDDNARGVICVGLPFPNSFDRSISAKKSYNDEQRKLRKRTTLLPGNEWYTQQAYRAVSQALGRCIRHAGDYGTVVLMDSRHCDDGAPVDGIPRAHKNLPKWMRHTVRNLSKANVFHGGNGLRQVLGGYRGLQLELTKFFTEAPIYSQKVLQKQKSDLAAAQTREKQTGSMSFNNKTGKWSQQTANVEAKPSKQVGRKMWQFLSPRPSVTQVSPSTNEMQSVPTPNEVVSISTVRSDRGNNGFGSRPVSSSSESQLPNDEEPSKKDENSENQMDVNENCLPNAGRAY